jgi:heme oxygenase (mycobilin-producing)
MEGATAMSRVILINPFEVPEGREGEALALWDEAAGYMRRQPGFISTRLHRALSPGARFTFVNVAEWETAEHFQAAIGSDEFRKLSAGSQERFPHHPALYEVIRT